MITAEERHQITEELLYELRGKMDGSRKNIIVPVCPFCGKDGGKYGIYVGFDVGKKRFGMSNCFKCGRQLRSLKETLVALGLPELLPKETAVLDDAGEDSISVFEDEIDDDLVEVEMPAGYKRCYKNAYLKSRGWVVDDYEYFPVGTNRCCTRDYEDYIILEVVDEGRRVGFVARSILSKEEIESHNVRSPYKIRRYKNSNESNGNGFSKLIYNYDAIVPMETHSVIVCEGPFDVVALNRKLDLYENRQIVPIATFGKKISMEQMYKLQKKGVEQVVIGFDNDAKETTAKLAMELEEYFDVLIADIPDGVGKDWDEMDVEDIYDIFVDGLRTVREFNLD